MNFKNYLIRFFLIDLIYMAFHFAKFLFKNPKISLDDIPKLLKEDEAEKCYEKFCKYFKD